MALLTAEEKAELAEKGVGYGLKEKCDSCGKPILSVTYIKKKQVLCASCATGQDLVLANTKEENKMAKAKAEKKEVQKKASGSKKVGGVLIAGSAIADLYELLSDEKKHSFSEGNRICSKHKKDLKGRLGNLGRVGLRKKTWGLIVDDEGKTIQMKLGKPSEADFGARSSGKKKEAPAKKATSKKEQEPEEKGAMPSKALKATMALVRRALKTGKDWTKNKLMEHLIKEHDQDPKRIAAAVQEEIKAGGIEVDDGILTLV